MQKKNGISLIVLVITIIVMIILAATIILAINNNNVVEKANDAVTETNLKQVQELAQTIWADAYIDGLRGENLKNDVLGELEDYTDKYNFEVTDYGVTVTQKGSMQLNEYGFYFDVPYSYVEEDGSNRHFYVFKSNNVAENYYYWVEDNYYIYEDYDNVGYDQNKIIFNVGSNNQWELSVSDDGKTLVSVSYGDEYVYVDVPYHGVYYGEKYHFYDGSGYMIFNKAEGNIKIYDYSNILQETITKESITEITSHEIELESERNLGSAVMDMDGKRIVVNGSFAYILEPYDGELIPFKLRECYYNIEYDCYAEPGMTWEEWVNSEYNTVNAELSYDSIHIYLPLENGRTFGTYVSAVVGNTHWHIDKEMRIMPFKYRMSGFPT